MRAHLLNERKGGSGSDGDPAKVTEGMEVRTADLYAPLLERICAHRDPRAVEFACFLLHSSKADPELAAFRAIDGMFDDPRSAPCSEVPLRRCAR